LHWGWMLMVCFFASSLSDGFAADSEFLGSVD